MIIALYFSIALGLIALGLIFWSVKQHQMNNDLHEVGKIVSQVEFAQNQINREQ